MDALDRRSFLMAAAGAAVVARTARADVVPRLRLGAPLSIAGDDPEALAKAHRAKGYRAAYCPNLRLDDRERIRATVDAFARHDVVIAEVGRWVNLLDADPEARRKNLQTVADGLALAEAVGARCCVDIAGSFSTTSWFGPHPDNLSQRFFDAAVENARKIIDAVEPTRTTFAYEMMAWSLPDSPDSCLRMLKAVDRKAFSVHLDPCNLVNSPERFYRSSELLQECYRKLGPYVASVHVKDLAWDVEMAVHFREVPIGKGSIDHEVFLTEHALRAPQAPLLLEHLPNAADYDAAHQALVAAAERAGVSFDEET